MPKPEKKPSITLETLLQVKRHERPDSDFWNSFESDFERRRLNALVERRSFWDVLWTPSMKALVFGAPALLLIGLGTFWIRYHEPVKSPEIQPAPLNVANQGTVEAKRSSIPDLNFVATAGMESASSQFVLDAIEDNSSRQMNFRKVLYTPAIRLSIPTGASYVKDSMSSRNYGVTTADMKLGRNF